MPTCLPASCAKFLDTQVGTLYVIEIPRYDRRLLVTSAIPPTWIFTRIGVSQRKLPESDPSLSNTTAAFFGWRSWASEIKTLELNSVVNNTPWHPSVCHSILHLPSGETLCVRDATSQPDADLNRTMPTATGTAIHANSIPALNAKERALGCTLTPNLIAAWTIPEQCRREMSSIWQPVHRSHRRALTGKGPIRCSGPAAQMNWTMPDLPVSAKGQS